MKSTLPSPQSTIKARQAFSIVELLAVIAIIAALGGMAGVAFSSLNSSGATNKACADFQGVLSMARTYAIANRTYVRIAMAQVDIGTNESALVVLPISAADGSLAADDAAAMSDPQQWPAIARPLILRDFSVNNEINAKNPDTSADLALDAAPPADDASAGRIPSFRRQIPSLGPAQPTFAMFVQFSPSGNASVLKGLPARYIKIGVEKRHAHADNRFILRLSGLNGTVSILRKEAL
jgi:Tfp pilus assembly protein FimT